MALSKASITGFFTTPERSFDITSKLLSLMISEMENEILHKYTFPEMKSTELEIYVDAEVESNKRRVIKMSNRENVYYLSFTFYLPYQTVVQKEEVNIPVFISEFTEALHTALAPYNVVPPELFKTVKKQLILKTKDNSKYKYAITDKEIEFRNNIKDLRTRIKSGLF